tara:strand:- start:3704 stop:4060 length:357 start_codon:yes stop_codon:yes gene_type:complete
MNSYEHTFISKQDLSENQNKKIIEKYENIINKNSGKVLKIQEWGLRNLTYKLKNNKKGYYTHIKFDGTGDTINELERAEIIDSSLLRFLTVKVKEHDLDTNFFEEKKFSKPVSKNEKK